MPKHWSPTYERFREVFERLQVDEDTVLVRHSCTTAFLLRWLSQTRRRVKKLVLVAPWLKGAAEIFHFELDSGVGERVGEIYLFTSDNERKEGKESLVEIQRRVGGEVIELPGRGHYDPGEVGP